jgi:SAM-dependent methyltransferase
VLKFRWRKDDLRRQFYPSDFRGMYQRFEEVIREYVADGSLVLDAGCGSGRIFRYDVGSTGVLIVGVDVTTQLRDNPNIQRPVLGDVQVLPFADASFEVVLTSHVVEHLPRPAEAFREMARVLKPDGRLLLLTPNRFHYVPLLAGILPHRLHVRFNRSRGVGERDIFPTVYRANTAGRLRRLLESAGLSVEKIERFETEPEYLAFHPLVYRLGVGYERLVNRFSLLASLRVNLIAVARKPSE